jgi:hypothetical protein
MLTEDIARVCYEANRVYCLTISENSQRSWDEAADWQKQTVINGVLHCLETLEKGSELIPSQSHESWLEEKRATGWKYGAVKDPEKKEHPCFLPYDKLPLEQKMKDYIFVGIVKAIYEATAKTKIVR